MTRPRSDRDAPWAAHYKNSDRPQNDEEIEKLAQLPGLKKIITMLKNKWKRVTVIGAPVLAILAVVANSLGVTEGLKNALNVGETKISSLETRVSAHQPDDVFHFALPTSVDLGDFPSGDSGCTADQRTWLSENGIGFQRDYFVKFRNGAQRGPALTVHEISGEGESNNPQEDRVLVECRIAPDVGPGEANARLDPSSGNIAIFDLSMEEDRAWNIKPNSLVAYNLQPGESSSFILSLVSEDDFKGQVDYEVVAGRDSGVEPFLPDSARSETLHMPGVISPKSLIFDVHGNGLSCRIIPNPVDRGVEKCEVGEYFNVDN